MNYEMFQNQSLTTAHPFVRACSVCGKKLVAKIQNFKKALLWEFRGRAYGNERMFQLALNEAEALAHETGFPLLVFPTLAREKAESIAGWSRHQRFVKRSALARLAA